MPSRGELVFANVADARAWEREGEGATPLAYVVSLPGRAWPITVARYWKAPQGHVAEHFEFVAPSGTVPYRSPRVVRRMPGQFDLTRLVDEVTDATFDELGVYAASFLIDGEVQGQVEFQVLLVAAPIALDKDVEEAITKSDVMWVGVEEDGRDHAVPVWFAYESGRIYVLHTDDPSTGDQKIPGLPDAPEVVVVTRHKYRDTRAGRFHAAVRLIEPGDPEFEQWAALLADRRRDRHGPPQDAVARWRSSSVIAELTPVA